MRRYTCGAFGWVGLTMVCAACERDSADSTAQAAAEGRAAPWVEPISGRIVVSGAQPATGNGDVTVTRRVSTASRRTPQVFTLEGSAGAIQHTLTIAFDTAGGVRTVTHRWENADNSVVVQTGCGGVRPCNPAQITADAKTRTVHLRALVLSGLDGNTGVTATSTLAGVVP